MSANSEVINIENEKELNISQGPVSIELSSNESSFVAVESLPKSMDNSSLNSDGFTNTDLSHGSEQLSPDSAIESTPVLTPDSENPLDYTPEDRLTSKEIEKPQSQPESFVKPEEMSSENSMLTSIEQQFEVIVNKEAEISNDTSKEKENTIDQDRDGGSDVNEDDDASDDDDDDDASEMVVEASMMFPLTKKTNDNMESSNSPEEKKPLLAGNVPVNEKPIEVTVQVKQQAVYKEASPSGCESDIEDNDDDDDTNTPEAPAASISQKALISNQSVESLQLPETVVRLDTAHGSSVFLVGTAHFSQESQDDVAKTIRAVKPDIVVVELCKARTAILQLDEETILQESRNLDFKKMQMILRQHGKIQGILYLLLLSVSAHITKQLGMAPGGEFRTAFAEARRSAPGCLIQFGDRPIQVTFSRALSSLSLWHKIKLTWHILTSKEPISKEEVEKYKQKDFIEEMLADMTGQFPAISEVFVKERDIYLCYSLQAAAQPIPNPMSPSGIAPRIVVGVVGLGHVPGIVERWGTVKPQDIPPIMRIPPPTLTSKVMKVTFKATLYGLVGFCLYKCLPTAAKSSIHSSLQSVFKFTTDTLNTYSLKLT